MSLFYRVLYRIGVTPWELLANVPAGDQVRALVDREQEGREPSYGRALDLGCGSGIWSVELAARGWDVTGVDLVPKAVRRARARARRASGPTLRGDLRFVEGDATELRSLEIGRDFRLVLDLGMIHGLPDPAREAVGREVSAIAAVDATLIVLSWAPGRRGPLPRGASRADLERVFPGWRVDGEETCDVTGAPGPVRRAGGKFYRLKRA